MQQTWSDIDAYIESHLIPEDPHFNADFKKLTADKGLTSQRDRSQLPL